jgi:hypothetical protein
VDLAGQEDLVVADGVASAASVDLAGQEDLEAVAAVALAVGADLVGQQDRDQDLVASVDSVVIVEQLVAEVQAQVV